MIIQRHIVGIYSIVLLWLPLFAVAQRHNNLDVEVLAQKIWDEENNTVKKFKYESTTIGVEDNTYYVVVKTDETGRDTLPGFMLIADCNNIPTLLAFDENSRFSSRSLPPHVKSWINAYKSLTLNSSNTKIEFENWKKASQTDNEDVKPLLGNREWGQDNPYNLLCPTIQGKHCPTGCVATALSQIMSYHQWPLSGTGSITYTTSSNKLDVSCDFNSTVFEWDKMLDTYIPFEDLSSQDEIIISDNKYFLNSIGIDDYSTPFSKCYVSINGLTVMGTSSFDGETVLLATDVNGNYVTRVSSSTSIISRSSGRILNSKSILLYVPSDLLDGKYHICCAVRSSAVNEWSLANVRGGGNYIEITKEGNKFSVENETYPCCPTSEDIMPVSTLLQAVGAAVKMDYSLNGSGSNDLHTAEGLVRYLNYDSDMFFAYPEGYSDEQWHEILQHELIEGRPVYYTGQGLESGHAFVIDGFKKIDDGTTYYHINWGWDGLCNGYYLLNMLRPSSTGTGGSSGSNYANQPSMLIGMKAEDGISDVKMNCSSLDVLKNDYSVGDFLPTRIRTLALQTAKDFMGSLRIILHNEDDEQEPVELYKNTVALTSKRGLTNYYASCQIPIEIPGGNYLLAISCKDNENNEIEIQCKEWPRITIRDISEWTGGTQTQPLKKLAIGGMVDIQPQDNIGHITLTVDSIVNPMPMSTTGTLSMIISDEEGKMISVASEATPINVSGYNVRRNVSVSSEISRYIPDGNYELRIGYLPQGDSLWTYCDRLYSEGEIWWAAFSPKYIPLSVTDGIISIAGYGSFEGADIPWVSSVHSITRESNTPEAIYDLSGRRIKNVQKGVCIFRRGNQSIKFVK